MALASLVALAQVLLEPALFGLAATLSGGGATQAMMVGNASAGVVVVAASVLTRLAAGGASLSQEQLGEAARWFYGLQIAYSVLSVGLYAALLRRSPRLAAAARSGAHSRCCAAAASQPLLAATRSTSTAAPSYRQGEEGSGGEAESGGRVGVATATTMARTAAADGDDGSGRRHGSAAVDAMAVDVATVVDVAMAGEGARRRFRERVLALRAAACAVWQPAACQALCFGVTLATWPSVPGTACIGGPFRRMGQDWWFTLVVAIYNLLDMAARVHLRTLQRVAARLSPRTCLRACVARTVLVPLVYACASPAVAGGLRGWADVAILLAVAVLALSNGLLATASMMQVAWLAPSGLSEECVYVAVAGVYLGLASGASFSWVADKALHAGSVATSCGAGGGNLTAGVRF